MSVRRSALLIMLLLTTQVGACAWWADKQRQIIYRPTPADEASELLIREKWPVGSVSRLLTVDANATPAQQISTWWWPQPAPTAPAVLFLHGTFRNLQGNMSKLQALHQAGFAVLAVDYRGWGRSTAITPSEQTITQDAWLAWQELGTRIGPTTPRYVMGHSMGGAAAVQLAARIEAASGCKLQGLILESTFSSMPDVARHEGRLGRVLGAVSSEKFDSAVRIAALKTPLLMLHGDADTTIAIELGRKLYDRATAPKQWVAFASGSHSRLQDEQPELYQRTLKNWRETTLQPSTLLPAAGC